MAVTATNTATVRDDAPDATGAASGAPDASFGGFDELFVQPVEPHDGRGSLPTLPSGWRHAGLVALVVQQPRERRETILAGGFALAAVVWAPLGVFAFMTRNTLLFGVLSLAAAVVAVAPRPATVSVSVGGLADRAGSALERVGPAIASTSERLAPLAAGLGQRLAPLAPRLRHGWDRVAAALRDAGQRVAAALRSADRSVSTAVRRGLEGLHSGGGRDHSTPSSAR